MDILVQYVLYANSGNWIKKQKLYTSSNKTYNKLRQHIRNAIV